MSSLRFLNASQVASQLIPLSLSLNYGDVFKIQHVHNPFPLGPVSFSSLAAYLECPRCAFERKQKKRPKEPKLFTSVQQTPLFGKGEPDARSVGTLLHTVVNFLHQSNGPLSRDQQQALLTNPRLFVPFLRKDILGLLQQGGKIHLAMFYDGLSLNEDLFFTNFIGPMMRYRQEFIATESTVLAGAERFQFKLLSTKNTFPNAPDWGGHVAFIGEFDQVRLRTGKDATSDGTPAIIEFKKGLGGSDQPSMSHAMQLMIYWMAFQTRWDILEKVVMAKGRLQEIPMPFQQKLDLIIYNLNDGLQYRLLPADYREALSALTECIFLLNWVMKSGYSGPSPEHDCKKTLLVDPPNPLIPVGYTTYPARECYLLAKEAFERFTQTVQWERV